MGQVQKMTGDKESGQYTRGLRAFRSGNFQTAVELLSDAVEIDEQNDLAWNALGTACAKIGRYEDADLCFENAISIAPDNPVYHKNKRVNAKHLKSGSPVVRPKKPLLERIPLDSLPLDRPVLLAGIVFAIILGAILILLMVFSTISTPPPEQGPPLGFSANISGDYVILTYEGGRDSGKISGLKWDVNAETGDEVSLIPGSLTKFDRAGLYGANLSAELIITVYAIYPDGNQVRVFREFLLPPAAWSNTTPEQTPIPTPTIPPDIPLFKQEEVLLNETTNEWYVIVTPPIQGTYSYSYAARTPDGGFTVSNPEIMNSSFKYLEARVRSVGSQSPGGTPAGIQAEAPPPVSGIPAIHPEPAYSAGDLINKAGSGDEGMMIVLGYDHTTDQYAVDRIYRYYTGEWGYREDSTPEWFIRQVLEEMYQHRIGRIAISDVGIGSDSAPPRTPVKYGMGDIISPTPSGVDHTLVVLEYNKTDDRYKTDLISPAYNGGWRREGEESWQKRAFIERDNPFLLRRIDLSLLKNG